MPLITLMYLYGIIQGAWTFSILQLAGAFILDLMWMAIVSNRSLVKIDVKKTKYRK